MWVAGDEDRLWSREPVNTDMKLGQELAIRTITKNNANQKTSTVL